MPQLRLSEKLQLSYLESCAWGVGFWETKVGYLISQKLIVRLSDGFTMSATSDLCAIRGMGKVRELDQVSERWASRWAG
jgi:hypothetical protein